MKYIPAESRNWIEGKGYKKNILLKGMEDLHSQGALVQLLTIEPNTAVPPHYHEKGLEVIYILKGRGMMTIGDEVVHLHEGDTLTCEPEEIHSAENPYDEPFELIVFKTNWENDDSIWLKEG